MVGLKTDKIMLKKFGITMGVAFLVITAVFSIKHRGIILPTAVISLLFFLIAGSIPALLKPLYIIWMKFAYILSWVNTRIILCLMFYLIFVPIGMVMKLLRVDLLDKKIEKEKDSYWHRKEKKKFNALDYQRQF